jgi:hypothetical protein
MAIHGGSHLCGKIEKSNNARENLVANFRSSNILRFFKYRLWSMTSSIDLGAHYSPKRLDSILGVAPAGWQAVEQTTETCAVKAQGTHTASEHHAILQTGFVTHNQCANSNTGPEID